MLRSFFLKAQKLQQHPNTFRISRSFAKGIELKPAKCYYKVLNLPVDSEFDTIKRTYLQLAKRYHPDISKEVDKEDKFKEIQTAYQILSKAETREEYDLAIGIRNPNWKIDKNFEPEFENHEEFMKHVEREEIRKKQPERPSVKDFSFEEENIDKLHEYFKYKYFDKHELKKDVKLPFKDYYEAERVDRLREREKVKNKKITLPLGLYYIQRRERRCLF